LIGIGDDMYKREPQLLSWLSGFVAGAHEH